MLKREFTQAFLLFSIELDNWVGVYVRFDEFWVEREVLTLMEIFKEISLKILYSLIKGINKEWTEIGNKPLN